MITNPSLERKRLGRSLAIVAVAAVLPYLRGVPNLFVAEDFDVLLASSLDLPLLWRLVFVSSVRIRPLALLIDWLGYRMWGTSPIGYHLTSLLLHLLCTLLVSYLGYLILEDTRAGLIAGLVFAVYPRHHGAVLWLAASQFLLGTLSVLAGLVFFVTYLRKRQWWYYPLISACVVLAPLAQEVGVLLLPLAFLVESILEHKSGKSFWASWRDPTVFGKYIPWVLFLAVFVLFSFSGFRAFKIQAGGLDPRVVVDAYHFLGLDATRAKDFLTYSTYLMWPHVTLRTLDVDLASLVLVGLSGGILLILIAKGKSLERFFLVWALIALLPFILFSPFGPTDRYFYLAGAGFALLIGRLAASAYRRFHGGWSRALLGTVLCVYLISSTWLLQRRIVEWREAGEMAQDIIEQVRVLYPQVPCRSRMFFVGLPQQHGQAYVFLGGGIGGAMRANYADYHLKVYRSFDHQLQDWLVSEEEGEATPGEYVFVYQGGTIRDRSACVADFDTLYESWWWYR